MAEQRGSPDRRGMGAQSDFIAQQFVPDERYLAQQKAMVRHLLATGLKPEQVEAMFLLPAALLSTDKPPDPPEDP